MHLSRWGSGDDTLLPGRIPWRGSPTSPFRKSHLVFSRLGFKVSSGRGFCGFSPWEIWEVITFTCWQSTIQASRASWDRHRVLTPGSGGETSYFLFLAVSSSRSLDLDHTSVEHSSASTVPVCSPDLLFSSPDLATPMSSS